MHAHPPLCITRIALVHETHKPVTKDPRWRTGRIRSFGGSVARLTSPSEVLIEGKLLLEVLFLPSRLGAVENQPLGRSEVVDNGPLGLVEMDGFQVLLQGAANAPRDLFVRLVIFQFLKFLARLVFGRREF